jgi:hypothetical protein
MPRVKISTVVTFLSLTNPLLHHKARPNSLNVFVDLVVLGLELSIHTSIVANKGIWLLGKFESKIEHFLITVLPSC